MEKLDEKIIERYLRGECSETEMNRILEWLNISEENRKEWLKLRLVPGIMSYERLSDPEYLEQAYNELLKEKALRGKLEREITHKVLRKFVRYAAAILIILGVSYFSFVRVSGLLYPEMMVLTVDESEAVKQLILFDSTKVWLSSGSKITYPGRFSGKERKVSVEGKVFFETARDEKRPFLVEADGFTVKVLGTSFEVNSQAHSNRSDVILVEGKVEILNRNNSSVICQLTAGQKFELDKRRDEFDLDYVDAGMYTAWRSGVLEFDDMSFAQIVRVLERHYNVRIVVKENMAIDQHLVGSLSFEKDIYEMMKTFAHVVPINFNVESDTVVYITSK